MVAGYLQLFSAGDVSHASDAGALYGGGSG